MKFVADQAIPHVQEAFSTIGEVTLMPSGQITPQTLSDADGLLIRTTVKVTPDLLTTGRIGFIGTATIGTDHIDLPFITSKSIRLASAPGCNANAVGEFVLTALLELQRTKGISLEQKTLGIIGAGNTGRAVGKKAEAIGIQCLFNDPPLARQSKSGSYMELTEMLAEADIISIHVPLTRSGEFPTFHLADESMLLRMKPGAILINTSRGEVLDGNALKRCRNRLKAVVLDVWENEPNIDRELIPLVDIATPHIAGYSIEGKLRATDMIYQAACRFYGQSPTWSVYNALKEYGTPELVIDERRRGLVDAVEQVYPILEDDGRLRKYRKAGNPGEYFANLRSRYRFRREFAAFQVAGYDLLPDAKKRLLKKAGFKISYS